MTLDEARTAFEYRFARVLSGPPRSQALPGGEYRAYAIGARIMGAAETAPVLLPESEELAIRALFNALNAYSDDSAAGGRNILIWRILPETDRYPGHKKGDQDPVTLQPYPEDQAPYWKAYARLIIANEAEAAMAKIAA